MKRKRGPVYLSAHAFQRWKQRVSSHAKKKGVAKRIRQRIAFELRNGAEVNKNGGLEIKIQPGIWAVCYPSLMGGWEVATIIREGWNGDMEEKAKYNVENDNRKLRQTIDYFAEAILRIDKILVDDCSIGLIETLQKQKGHFEVALEAMNLIWMVRGQQEKETGA